MRLSPNNIDTIFHALGKQISFRAGTSVEVVVCGGTALAVLDLVHRATKDVDVLAWARTEGKDVFLDRVNAFPVWLEESAAAVASDFDLPGGWFNAGPASQLDLGLPGGFEGRLVRRTYGPNFTIHFISRVDQIHFKLFAAVDRNDYHTQDLLALKPTPEEMLDAARWVVTQDVSEPFRMVLEDFLTKYGFADVTDRI